MRPDTQNWIALDDLQRIITQYPQSVVRDYLAKTEEVLKWLRQHPNLQ